MWISQMFGLFFTHTVTLQRWMIKSRSSSHRCKWDLIKAKYLHIWEHLISNFLVLTSYRLVESGAHEFLFLLINMCICSVCMFMYQHVYLCCVNFVLKMYINEVIFTTKFLHFPYFIMVTHLTHQGKDIVY